MWFFFKFLFFFSHWVNVWESEWVYVCACLRVSQSVSECVCVWESVIEWVSECTLYVCVWESVSHWVSERVWVSEWTCVRVSQSVSEWTCVRVSQSVSEWESMSEWVYVCVFESQSVSEWTCVWVSQSVSERVFESVSQWVSDCVNTCVCVCASSFILSLSWMPHF